MKLGKSMIWTEKSSVAIEASTLASFLWKYGNADGYGVIIGEDSDGMIQKSNGIGNWMKDYLRKATSQEVRKFFAKVRKTQKIINY